METKVIILGEEPTKIKEPKKIELREYLSRVDTSIDFEKASSKPSVYKNIELISKSYINNLDLMFAYGDDRDFGYLYLGLFNDGVV